MVIMHDIKLMLMKLIIDIEMMLAVHAWRTLVTLSVGSDAAHDDEDVDECH